MFRKVNLKYTCFAVDFSEVYLLLAISLFLTRSESKQKDARARFAAIAFSDLRNNHRHHHRRHFGLFSSDTLVSARLFARTIQRRIKMFLKRIVSISTTLSIIGFDKLVVVKLLTHSLRSLIVNRNRFTRFKCAVEHIEAHTQPDLNMWREKHK